WSGVNRGAGSHSMTNQGAGRGGRNTRSETSIGPGGAAALPNRAAGQAEPNQPGGGRRGRFGLGSRRTFAALTNRDFRLLLIGNFLQFGAMQMQMLVRGVLVYDLTGSFAALGLVALANAIPGLLLSPIGGVVADRASKKTMIQLAQWT